MRITDNPDSAASDVVAIALAIFVVIVLVALCSVMPAIPR